MIDGINVGSFQVTNLDKPFEASKIIQIIDSQFKGGVTYDGFWSSNPAAGWNVEKLGTGLYRVNHYQGNINYSVNAQLPAGVYGGANPMNLVDNSFDIQVVGGDGTPVDAGFGFAVAFALPGVSS